MKTVNINASTNSKRIPIGRCEDNEATRVVFDCSGFSSAYGSGQATLLHRRSKEKISYIVQNVAQSGSTVTWTVSSDDTAFSGEGTLQLMWTVNDVVVHSHFYTTITDPSLTDSSTEPTEVKSALQLLIDSCYTKEETDDLIAHMKTGANWNANEGEDGYIENRPFYEAVDKVKICDGIAQFNNNQDIKVDGKSFDYSLIDGATYIVEYNGQEYTCVASRHPDSNFVYIGSGQSIGYPEHVKSEYPFNLYNQTGSTNLMGMVNDSSVSLFSLYTYGNSVHKLDSKYLDGKLITIGNGTNAEVFNDSDNNNAIGDYSHCEGKGAGTQDVLYTALDGGAYTLKSGSYGESSHVEGDFGRSDAPSAHVEGHQCYSRGYYSHSEGRATSALNTCSHSEGSDTVAGGAASHSEGQSTKAKAACSHSEGMGTIATADASHVGGKFNIEDTNKIYAEIIGNGTSKTRSNARTLDWNGNESLAGSLTLGMNTNDEITITPAQLAKLLGLVKENHWESNFMIPDGYITTNSSQVYTASEASALSNSSYPVYYLPEVVDFDTLSSLEIKAPVFSSTPFMAHKTVTSFDTTISVLWFGNCRCVSIAGGAFFIINASDAVTVSDAVPYEFPNNVKTVIITNGYKPNAETGMVAGNTFLSSLSLDWTLK